VRGHGIRNVRCLIPVEPDQLATVRYCEGDTIYMMQRESAKRPSNMLGKARAVLFLAFFLVVGPLEAQALYTCTITAVTSEKCCCSERKSLGEHGRSAAKAAPEKTCCERSVTLKVSDESVDIAKTSIVKSDVSPPTSMASQNFSFTVFDKTLTQPKLLPVRLVSYDSNIYLTTERLRL